MLRFERKSRNRDVSISLRNQDKLLNRLSMTAFGIALGFHLFGVLLFQVSSFKISGITSVLPPVVVRSDTVTSSDSVVFANIEGTHEVIPQIKTPPFSVPELPSMPKHKNLSFDPGAP
jgi:hypothetical protein